MTTHLLDYSYFSVLRCAREIRPDHRPGSIAWDGEESYRLCMSCTHSELGHVHDRIHDWLLIGKLVIALAILIWLRLWRLAKEG